VAQDQLADLQRIRTGSAAPPHQSIHHSGRHAQKRCDRHHRLRILPFCWRIDDSRLTEHAPSAKPRSCVAARVVRRGRCCTRRLQAFREKASTSACIGEWPLRAGTAAQRLASTRRSRNSRGRNVRAQPDFSARDGCHSWPARRACKSSVPTGAHRDCPPPVCDFARAAADQHIGDRLRDSSSSAMAVNAPRSGSGDGDEIVSASCRTVRAPVPPLRYHRRVRDAAPLRPATCERRQPARQFGARLDPPRRSPAEHETERPSGRR